MDDCVLRQKNKGDCIRNEANGKFLRIVFLLYNYNGFKMVDQNIGIKQIKDGTGNQRFYIYMF